MRLLRSLTAKTRRGGGGQWGRGVKGGHEGLECVVRQGEAIADGTRFPRRRRGEIRAQQLRLGLGGRAHVRGEGGEGVICWRKERIEENGSNEEQLLGTVQDQGGGLSGTTENQAEAGDPESGEGPIGTVV